MRGKKGNGRPAWLLIHKAWWRGARSLLLLLLLLHELHVLLLRGHWRIHKVERRRRLRQVVG
jgi:hypothetical protein